MKFLVIIIAAIMAATTPAFADDKTDSGCFTRDVYEKTVKSFAVVTVDGKPKTLVIEKPIGKPVAEEFVCDGEVVSRLPYLQQ